MATETESTPNTTPASSAVRPLIFEAKGAIEVPVVNKMGESVGTISIDPEEFSKDGKISRQLLHDVVLMYLANQRAGTHHTLRRGEVAGSTKKVFRQKGTGNARIGPKRTNKRRGGGTAKGPKPRDYEYHMPKQAVRAATRMAILSKLLDKETVIVDEFAPVAPKTKEVLSMLKSIKLGKKKTTDAGKEIELTFLDTTVLIGTDQLVPNVYKSARNIVGVEVLPTAEFNAYMVLRQKRLVLTKAALEALRAKKKAD